MLEEEDFAIFRTSFESGRQTPETIRKGIVLAIIMQIVMGVGIFAAADPTVSPEFHKATLLIVQYTCTLCLFIYSIIYAIPKIYMKKQHIQFLVASLSLLNFIGIFPFYGLLFILVRLVEITEKSFFSLAIFILVSGIIFYIAIIFRLQRSIHAGHYRKDSTKHNYSEVLKRDRAIFSRLPELIIIGIGLVFIIRFILTNMFTVDTEMMILFFMLFALFYMGIFMFAYSIIVVYCKKRFASFNFDENGNLYPLGSGDRVRDKELA